MYCTAYTEQLYRQVCIVLHIQSSCTDTEDENERPSWFNNAPIQDTDHVNPMSALKAMKADTAAQKTYVDKQEKKLIKVSKEG